MSVAAGHNIDRELERFNDQMVEHNLTPTWAYYPELVAKEPPVAYRPYLWKADLLDKVVQTAGDLVDLNRGGERRSFEVVNPDLRHLHGTTHTLGAALQLVQPGEIAPPHRHLANAIRFIVKGRGSYTAVEGERLYMEERDLILTPTWMWHEHGNETDHPVVWVDALDYPLNKLMQLSFFEPGTFESTEQRPVGFTSSRVGMVRPAWTSYPDDIPNVTYRWSETAETLNALRNEQGSPYDGIRLEYVNPINEGSVLPTMACYAQMLREGEHGMACRRTSSSIHYVLDGEGSSVIGGVRFDWAPGDFFMIPPWTWFEHANTGDGDAVHFVVSDTPVMRALKLWREEPLEEGGGHQHAGETFTPLDWR